MTPPTSIRQGSQEGWRVCARIESLIATRKMNDIEPLRYLTRTLEAIVNGYPEFRIDELLPGSFAHQSMRYPGTLLETLKNYLIAALSK